MATPYSNPSTQKLVIGFFLLLIIMMKSAEAVNFNMRQFINDGSLILQGDAKIQSDGSLALPSDPSTTPWAISRALYATPVPIWESTSNRKVNFQTTFSFSVTDVPGLSVADGLVFFLAPWGTNIPSNSSGRSFGINKENDVFNRFVAVEFDSHPNPSIDPNYAHIGIDVNSIISLKTVEWNRVSGSLEKVTIDYSSTLNTLTVDVAHQNGSYSTIYQEIDLKELLPEKVSVGFSATVAGVYRERHDIYSWSFRSVLRNTNSNSRSSA